MKTWMKALGLVVLAVAACTISSRFVQDARAKPVQAEEPLNLKPMTTSVPVSNEFQPSNYVAMTMGQAIVEGKSLALSASATVSADDGPDVFVWQVKVFDRNSRDLKGSWLFADQRFSSNAGGTAEGNLAATIETDLPRGLYNAQVRLYTVPQATPATLMFDPELYENLAYQRVGKRFSID